MRHKADCEAERAPCGSRFSFSIDFILRLQGITASYLAVQASDEKGQPMSFELRCTPEIEEKCVRAAKAIAAIGPGSKKRTIGQFGSYGCQVSIGECLAAAAAAVNVPLIPTVLEQCNRVFSALGESRPSDDLGECCAALYALLPD